MSTVMPPDDRRSLGIRLSVLQYSIACIFALLAVGFWVFQVAKYAEFKEIAQSQYLQRVPLPAPRGLIVDRNGKELVENQNSIKIVLMRERTSDVDATLQALVDRLRHRRGRKIAVAHGRPLISVIENERFAAG